MRLINVSMNVRLLDLLDILTADRFSLTTLQQYSNNKVKS